MPMPRIPRYTSAASDIPRPWRLASAGLNSLWSDNLPSWYANWIASLPLILLTVVIHVLGLVVLRDAVLGRLDHAVGRRRFGFVFPLVMGITVLLITGLHAIEAAAWGVVYLLLGALPD